MKRVLVIVFGLALLVGGSLTSAFADGDLFGTFTVTPYKGTLENAKGFSVLLFDAENAEPLFTDKEIHVTDGNGQVNISVPAGVYKILVVGKSYDVSCTQEYVGAGSLAFELGQNFAVTDGTTTEVSEELTGYYCPPKLIEENPDDAYLGISVFDAKTLEALPEINVKLLDPESALLIAEGVTDSKGNCTFGSWKGSIVLNYQPVKIRLFDRSGIYQPEYLGAGGTDSFSLGATVDFGSDPTSFFKEGLVMQSTSGKIEQIIHEIKSIGVDSNVSNSLIGHLVRAVDIIEDNNPNNDQAACGALKGFINQLNGRVNSGQISKEDAFDLEVAAAETFKALECK